MYKMDNQYSRKLAIEDLLNNINDTKQNEISHKYKI